ncbi:type I-E CRISPR-associated protein Cas5/CasD [Streptomyces sp. ODS28]|uniref:type I-E CRISPR-associated protein Cas5/CasD n=1 Tax=Streptomyces sp. ODS28 TaxID=3136688 RepID=UPI0031E87A2C
MNDNSSPQQRGFLIQLAAPLQSWGERSRFVHQRDTAAAPTRSGLIGMLAAAHGRQREEPCEDLAPLRFTVRLDRRGTHLRDLHTVGGGMPRHLTVATAEDKRRSGDKATLLSHRFYLQDAVFTVAVTSDDTALLERCAARLRRPRWAPYLGRRSCPPSGPLVLTKVTADAATHLLHLPLARTAPRPGSRQQDSTVSVEFTTDAPLSSLLLESCGQGETVAGEAQDDPISYLPLDRRYRTRPVHRSTLHRPAGQCGGLGTDYLNRLSTYLTDNELGVSSS